MMKNLMMGTAIALLATAGAVSAQEWSVDVKGVFKAGFGYVDIDDGNDDVGLVRDPEIHVIGELVADNGLTFGIRTEIEPADDDNDADIFDENFAYVRGAFGRFEVGEADGAADWAKYAGDVGSPWSRSGDGVGMLFDSAYYSAESGAALDAFSGDTSDDLKLSYYTPSFAGFSAGVSYAPSTNDDGRNSNRGNDVDAWELGAQYSGEFGGFSVGAGVGYTSLSNDDSAIGGGVSVGFSGFELGVSYGNTENGGGVVNGNELDAEALQVGLSYGTGPWTVGADVAFHLDEVEVAGNQAGEQLGVSVGVAYALAPGVSVGLGGEYLDADVNGQDDSLAIATWMGLSF